MTTPGHLALFRLVGLSKRNEPTLTAFTGFPFALYGKPYGTKVVQFCFRVELHSILVEISFQLASFKSTRRESTRSVRECISTGREIWSVENVFPPVENFGRPPVGRSRISQANSAGQQAFLPPKLSRDYLDYSPNKYGFKSR